MAIGVFGDTHEITYSFETKVAGSNLECPCKIYRALSTAFPTLPTPSEITAEETTQSELDKFKTQDGTTAFTNTLSNGQIKGYMVEVDLTPLANSVGGNSALVNSAFKKFMYEIWCMGSGSNGGVTGYGVDIKVWQNNSTWANWTGNTSNTITKCTDNSSTLPTPYINANNKVYILIASKFPSDGTIPSSVSLDYLKVTVQLNRVPDVVSPIPVNLPRYWGMVVKGFSPMWDSTNTQDKYIFKIYKDSSNWYEFKKISTNAFRFVKSVVGVTAGISSNAPSFNKNQVYNFLVQQTNGNMIVSLLKNNGTVEKYILADGTNFNGNSNLYVEMNSSNINQADSFLDNITLIDLEKAGKVRFGQELVINGDFSNGGNSWGTVGGTSDFSTGKAVLTSSANSQYIHQLIAVTPNTTYKLSCGDNNSCVYCDTYSDVGGVAYVSTIAPITLANGIATLTTPSNCVSIRVKMSSWTFGAGTFTFDNISLKQVLQDGFTDSEAQSILDGSDKYYVTTTSDYANKVAGSVIENPNVSKYVFATSLLSPSSFSSELGNGMTNVTYGRNMVLDSITNNIGTSVVGQISQALFSFDVISHLERKYGTLPCPQDLASKIVWAKANISSLNINLYGYGMANGTNKVYLKPYWVSGGTYGSGTSSTATTPSLVTMSINNATINSNSFIDNNGFVHFNVSTDPVTAGNTATLYIDYISLDITAKIVPTNPNMPNPELFDINAVTLDSHATRSNGVITLNATGAWQESYQYISVLPNNKYEVKASINTGMVIVHEYYNNVLIKTNSVSISGATSNSFVTLPNTNKIRVMCTNSSAGTFTFSGISLKRKD